MASMDMKLLIEVLSQIEVGHIDYDPRNSVGGAKKFGLVSPKKAGPSSKKKGHRRPKKSRRRTITMESDEEEEEDEEEMDYDKEAMDVEIKMEIPSRKLPYRRARATNLVEETSDAENEQEEKEYNVQGR
ncbi:hypothetical protein DID88_008156 [Monilinia fructigena]|uniref:Uncharacterized protein n=1 Tax=Monilinia fructigena TaxID=38457 RepID=A0A395J4Y0_9HELO|nr:hypothetical protein DID88_008156 [Monilinia fructigena]